METLECLSNDNNRGFKMFSTYVSHESALAIIRISD